MKFPILNSPNAAGLPMMLTNWIFGFGVIQYPVGTPRPFISVLWSIANFLAYLNFVRLANFAEIAGFQGSVMAANNYRVTAYFCVVFVAISMCLAHFRTKTLRRSFINFAAMNLRLMSLGIPNDYELSFKSQVVHICVAFAWIIAIVVLDFEYINFGFPSRTSRFGFLMSFHYFLVFAFLVDCSFIANIRYYGNRFKRLNSLILELNSPEKSKATLSQPDNKFPSHFSVVREIHGNYSPSLRAASKQWRLHVMRETRRIHRGFCSTATELNRTFGIQMLLSVAMTFFLIITLLYTSYLLGTLNTSISSNWQGKILLLMWIIFCAMKLLLIVDASETTSCEANRTGELISNLLNMQAYDEDIRDEINIFSLQLLKNPLIFTASGFFRLNYSLIRGILGSVTTYLVIMIQMRSIYEPEDVIARPNSTILVPTNGTD